MDKIYNFSAGPAMLPHAVLAKAQQELLNWQGTGSSVMEISHRSAEFLALVRQAEQDLRALLNINDNYHVLYAQGGARAQFAAVPMNLLGEHKRADYIDSGYWAKSAISEAKKYCAPNAIDVVVTDGEQKSILPAAQWQLSDNAAYVHFCSNETIDGIELNEVPLTDKPLVADMSSNILSRPLDVNQYGVIYAGAQKNIGPAGLTLVIVRDDLLGHAKSFLPNTLDYTTLAKKESMFNTPPTFAWYLASEVYQWLLAQGGLTAMAKHNQEKAELLYRYIDSSDFYQNNIAPSCRSRMNVPFLLADSRLDSAFLAQAQQAGLHGLKGHRDVGGMRASIYNAMPLEGVQALVSFLDRFAKTQA